MIEILSTLSRKAKWRDYDPSHNTKTYEQRFYSQLNSERTSRQFSDDCKEATIDPITTTHYSTQTV